MRKEVKLSGGPEVQRIELSPADFLHNYQHGSGPVAIADWSEIWQGKLYLGPSFAFKKLKDAEGKKSYWAATGTKSCVNSKSYLGRIESDWAKV
ncbi:hypothetical protein N9Y42_02680 [Mariniblastus sp.]|nr:hypothetical protein [Mariniblastus sp.]